MASSKIKREHAKLEREVRVGELCAVRAKGSSRKKKVSPKVERDHAKLEREVKVGELCAVRATQGSHRKMEVIETQTVRIKREKSRKNDEDMVDKRDPNPIISKARHHTFIKGGRDYKRQAYKSSYAMADNLEATYSEFGEPSLIQLQSNLPNTSRRTGVVVEIEASTVSFTDCLIRRNLFSVPVFDSIDSATTGVDCVGRLVWCGDLAQKRDNLKIGDRVFCLWPFLGGNTRFASLPSEHVHRVPDSVDPTEAVCIVRSYLAAIQILYRTGGMDKKIKKAHRVLVTGANGNIGRAVVELSKSAGAIVYASCMKEHKAFMLDVMDSDKWLNEDPTTWSDNLSMDIIVDCVCFTGNPRYLLKFLSSKGVKLVNVGNARGDQLNILKQIQQAAELSERNGSITDEGIDCGIEIMPKKNIRNKEDIYKQNAISVFSKIANAMTSPFMSNIYDYDLFDSIEERQDLMADDMSLLFNLLETGIIRPKIALEVGLHEIHLAQELIEAGGLQGAIVCRP